MFLPVGPEHHDIRRKPLVTLGIMLGLFALYVVRLYMSEPNVEGMKHALNYRAQHPYLRAADPHFEMIFHQMDFWTADEQQSKPSTVKMLDLNQKTLDGLVTPAMEAMNRRIEARVGLVPSHPSPWGLFTYTMFQPGLLGLLLNLYLFYMTAPYLEDRWGRVFFGGFCLGSGVLAGALFMVTYPNDWQGILGVSPVVAATVGAYMVRYPKNRIRLRLMANLPGYSDHLIKPVIFFSVCYGVGLGAQYVSIFVLGNFPIPGYLPYVVNLYGLGLGAATAYVLHHFNWETVLYKTPFEKLLEDERLTTQIANALDAAKPRDAFHLMKTAWAKYPTNRTFQAQLWDQSVRLRLEAEVGSAGKDLIHHLIEEGNYQQAFFHWQEYTDAFPGENITISKVDDLTHGLLSIEHRDETREVLRYTFRHQGRIADKNVLMHLLTTASLGDPIACLEGVAVIRRRSDLDESDLAQLAELEEDTRWVASSEEAQGDTLQLSRPVRGSMQLQDLNTPLQIKALRISTARLRGLQDEGIWVILQSGREVLLEFGKIKALTAAAIRPIDGKPFLVLDLLAESPDEVRASHAVLRVDTRRFDPRQVVKEQNPAQAMRRVIEIIMQRAAARPLPDRAQVLGTRFPSYPALDEMERHVYGVVSG